MPFKSDAQRRFLFKEHPAIARRWAKKYGTEPKPPKKPSRKAVKRKLDSTNWK